MNEHEIKLMKKILQEAYYFNAFFNYWYIKLNSDLVYFVDKNKNTFK